MSSWMRAPGRGPILAVALILLLAAPMVGVLLIGLVRSILIPIILIWTTIPFYLMIAAGILSLKQRWLQGLVFSVVVGLHLWGLAHYYTSYRKEAWHKAARFVARQVTSGDLILIHVGQVREPFHYYFRNYEKDVQQIPLWGGAAEIEGHIRALPPHERFWLVLSGVPFDALPEVLAVVGRYGVIRKSKPFKGVYVLLYDTS